MNKTMKAARLYGPYDLRMMDVPIPELEPDQILAKVNRACVCGTDYSIYSGELSFVKTGDVTFPMTMGHEWAGTVAAVGSDVKDFKVGDRILSDNNIACGRCLPCLSGLPHMCPNSRPLGTVHAWDGAFAEYLVIPERQVFHLPDQIDWDTAALYEPMTVAYSGVVGAEVHYADNVLVYGTGSIGLIAARLCRLAGARVFLVGRNPLKLQVAKDFEAADVYIDTREETVPEALKRYIPTGRVDKVIEASGSLDLLLQSLDVVRTSGFVVPVAFYEKELQNFPIDKLVFGNITLRGMATTAGLHPACLRALESGKLNLKKLISGRYAFKDIEQALKDMKTRNKERIKWVIDYE